MNKFQLFAVPILTLLAISTQASAANAINFRVELSGDQEVPPVATDASGTAIIHFNQRLTEIDFKLDVRNGQNMLGAAGSHFHCAAAGANGPVIVFLAGTFPPGYDDDFQIRATLTDANIINGGTACGSTIADIAMAMANGDVYINVHSTSHPAGEIRGQVE